MGTNGKLQYFFKNYINGILILKKIINKIKYIERIFTKFSPFSEINIINKNKNFINISYDTLNILKISNKMLINTYKYFNISLGNYLTNTGLDCDLPIYKIIKIKNLKRKIYIYKKQTISKFILIDLGGIGKGYGIDLISNLLNKNNITNFAFELGGDIIIKNLWKIIIDKKISFLIKKQSIKIQNNGISITGNYQKKTNNNNFINHHILNSKTLSSNNFYTSIIIKGKHSTICDALSTSCFNMKSFIIIQIKEKFFTYNIKTYI